MPPDIYAEPAKVDLNTLLNLGPLTPLAGTWEGTGTDHHPVASGGEDTPYRERVVFEPLDPQLNGPQLLYGLRYHLHVNELDEALTFHDQLGYWLWEPAQKTLIQTLAIPRAQVAMASGTAGPEARSFTVRAEVGDKSFGICSAPFLERSFRTREYTLTITINPDGTLSYEQDTVLEIPGRELFHHTDRATLRKVAEPRPNPGWTAGLAR